ncbi:MAG TPA: tRNA-intron lyase, partial [Nitrososphaerales archaeon]|nr:tRNA-intron lyase [Nitrososphaerales archaeon]
MEESETAAPVIEAQAEGQRIVISQKERVAELEENGYGTREGKSFVLRDYEALYLVYSKKLRLTDSDGKEVGFEELAESTQRRESDAWTKFIIYRDLRSRGYVVREGFGFGTDLRVYERGDYPKKPAQYVVFALDEGIEKNVEELQRSVKEMARMGK